MVGSIRKREGRDRPMTAELQLVSANLGLARAQIQQATAAVNESTDPIQIEDHRHRIAVARTILEQLGKIDEERAQIHHDLMVMEIACLRRIATLDALKILSGEMRNAAKWFAGIPEDHIEAFVNEWGYAASARAAYRNMRSAERDAELAERKHADYRRGISIASGDRPDDRDDRPYYSRLDLSEAIEVLLDTYAADGEPFHIADIADRVIIDLGIPDDAIAGIREVCRKAVSSGKSVVIDGRRAPKFVTCIVDGQWARIPFANATLRDLDQMIEQRQRGIVEDRKALNRLMDLRDRLGAHPRAADPAATMSQLAALMDMIDTVGVPR